jgi:hypothetical protein
MVLASRTVIAIFALSLFAIASASSSAFADVFLVQKGETCSPRETITSAFKEMQEKYGRCEIVPIEERSWIWGQNIVCGKTIAFVSKQLESCKLVERGGGDFKTFFAAEGEKNQREYERRTREREMQIMRDALR